MAESFISKQTVEHIARLAKIPVADKELEELARGFNEVLGVVNKLSDIDVSKVEPTHQVTDLENVSRDDAIDEKKMLSQNQALKNAPRTHQGYFVIGRVLNIEF
jgi:aspartyl-tRNA(Asn)/glutamyl-tRNA(Gln) amidotransferase subunit C